MSTVYPYPDSHASYEAPDIDMSEIERIAQYCVTEVCKKWLISGALYREHRDDMRQTGMVTVYEEKIINQAAGGRKAPCCCLVCLIEQRLKGLGAEKWLKNKALRGVRCMFVGSQVYVYGELFLLRCMFVGSRVYVYGA